MIDGATASAKTLRSKIITLLELIEDVLLTTVQDAVKHFKDLTPPATTKEIGRQVEYVCLYLCVICQCLIYFPVLLQIRILISRYGCVRSELMSFSAGGRRHDHAVVRALYFELLGRIMSKEVVLCRPLSIVESVMPKRESWRGVGGNSEKEEVFKR